MKHETIGRRINMQESSNITLKDKRGLKKLWNIKVTVIPVAIGGLGTILEILAKIAAVLDRMLKVLE